MDINKFIPINVYIYMHITSSGGKFVDIALLGLESDLYKLYKDMKLSLHQMYGIKFISKRVSMKYPTRLPWQPLYIDNI